MPSLPTNYDVSAQNKPNSPNPKTAASDYATKPYTNILLRSAPKNKPNSDPKQTHSRARGAPVPPRRESIEHRVSRIEHFAQLTKHSGVYYAKQTQFSQAKNQHNILWNKGLQEYSAPPHSKKQTQFKPNPAPPVEKWPVNCL
ncbi:MAG: hypothetical protein ISS79_08655 [Phycisphaerae bacterium]|nr:hypothetical protein [Phycisphaerae bacterium]